MKREIEELRARINHHDKKYYDDDSPEITDQEYDNLMKRLIKLEKDYPEFSDPNSPSRRVGGFINPKFTSIQHVHPMLSLNNAFSEGDLVSFDIRVAKGLEKENEQFIYMVEPKFDGISIILTYKNGSLLFGTTRGDGNSGEDITENITKIQSIPIRLCGDWYPIPETLVVRGEAFITKKDFEIANKNRTARGKDPFSNPRNAVAGTLRQKDPSKMDGTPISAFVYSMEYCSDPNILLSRRHSDALSIITEYGLPTCSKRSVVSGVPAVMKECIKLNDARDSLEFEIDGAVVKLDDLNGQNKLGAGSKYPKWAIAYKFPAKEYITQIKRIGAQTGRTGVITPVAFLEPIEIDGVIVKKATLHNYDEVAKKDIRSGDFVVVERAGDVIPAIIRPVTERRTGKEIKITSPDKCPECGSPTKRKVGEVALKCTNKDCSAQLVNSINTFVGRDALDIEGLSKKTVEQLVDNGLINELYEIFNLTEEDLLTLDGFAEKSSKKLIQNIKKSSTQTLDKFIYCLGIKYIGRTASKKIAQKFSTLKEFRNAPYDELISIDGIGEKAAESVITYFNDVDNLIKVTRLEGVIKIKAPQVSKTGTALSGKSFVITGTLEKPREHFKKLIEDNGGIVKSSVSKKIDFLLCGDSPGSKKKKAEDLGVKILSEKELGKLIGE